MLFLGALSETVEVGIVECGTKGVRNAAAHLAPFVDRPRYLRCAMTAKLSREGEGAKKLQHPAFILRLLWIDLRIRAFEIAIRDHCRRAMPWTGDVDHVQLIFANCAVQMYPGEMSAQDQSLHALTTCA